LLFHVGSDEVAIRSPRASKTDFRAVGRLIKGSGSQAVFSILPIAGNDEGRNGKSQQINNCLQDWCRHQNFVIF